jgi:site-specific DNA-methyltransferase (adenine-specific)
MINQIIHGDCFEILKTIPDGSIDAVITDPPYGIGLAEWDSVVDIPLFTKEVKRVTNGFYAFFGQMPTMVNWINSANNEKLHYCEHISWVKRKEMPVHPRLKRKHESILIYSQDSTKKYFKQTGLYEDVKVPGLLFDVITIQAIQRTISELKTGRGGTICQLTKAGQFGSANRKLGKEHRRINGNDTNYTNVWSFLPPVFNNGRCQKQSYLHPTEKPLEIMKRLVEMLTPEGGTILDPFAGSGTTALACKELNRNYICIEKEREYVDIIHQRLNTPITERGLTVEEQVEIEKTKPPYQQLSLF